MNFEEFKNKEPQLAQKFKSFMPVFTACENQVMINTGLAVEARKLEKETVMVARTPYLTHIFFWPIHGEGSECLTKKPTTPPTVRTASKSEACDASELAKTV